MTQFVDDGGQKWQVHTFLSSGAFVIISRATNYIEYVCQGIGCACVCVWEEGGNDVV